MALHFAEGEFTAFFWGQSYGGTIEAALAAALFKIFGFSVLLPKVVTIGLHGFGAWLTWRVGLRLFSKNTAAIAGALAWTWPTFAVWKSNRLLSFYALGLVLVMGIVLLVLRVVERPLRHELFLLGLVVGVGWWTHPTVLFAAAPMGIWLNYRRPDLLRMSAIVATGAAIGSFPWIWSNVSNEWHSVRSALLVDSFGQYWDALGGLFVEPFPAALGLRITGSPHWVVGPVVGIGLYLAILVGLAWRWRNRSGLQGLLFVAVIGYLAVLAISEHALYRAEPKYLYVIMPILALLLADLAKEARMQLLLPSVLTVFSVVGLYVMSQFPKDPWVPRDFKTLITTLEEEGIDRVFAFHTIAYRLSFESGEEIIATPIDHVRYQPYDQAVRTSPDAAYVFAPLPVVAENFQHQLDEAGVEYAALVSGDFTVVIPRATVLPDEFDSLRPDQTVQGSGLS